MVKIVGDLETKEKGFKKWLPMSERKLKRVMTKQPFFTIAQIFGKDEIERAKKKEKGEGLDSVNIFPFH